MSGWTKWYLNKKVVKENVFREVFGDVGLKNSNPAPEDDPYLVMSLIDSEDHVSPLFRVTVKHTGIPVEGIGVFVTWNGAPLLEGTKDVHGVIIKTNADGYVDWIMGKEAYYFPPAGGPFSIWITNYPGTPVVSEQVYGLGMLGGTEHRHVDVVFDRPYHTTLKKYRLNVDIEGPGSVNVFPSKSEYDQGESVELTVIPDMGAKFVRWYGDCTGTDPVVILYMNSDKYVTATFEEGEAPPPSEVRDLIATAMAYLQEALDIIDET